MQTKMLFNHNGKEVGIYIVMDRQTAIVRPVDSAYADDKTFDTSHGC